MKNMKYHLDIRGDAYCKNITMEEMSALYHRKEKYGTKYYFIFVSWFGYKQSAGAPKDLGDDFIGILKPITNSFCKDTIYTPMKYCPVGYYLVINRKKMLPMDIQLVTIVCSYNSRKFLSSVVTEVEVIIKSGITCLYYYPDQFSNVSIIPIVFT